MSVIVIRTPYQIKKSPFNVGEYGQILYVNLGESIAGASEYTVLLEPQVGAALERKTANGVALGTENVIIGDETYRANEYLTYPIKDGELDQSGKWRAKGLAQLSTTNLLVGDYKKVTVMP